MSTALIVKDARRAAPTRGSPSRVRCGEPLARRCASAGPASRPAAAPQRDPSGRSARRHAPRRTLPTGSGRRCTSTTSTSSSARSRRSGRSCRRGRGGVRGEGEPVAGRRGPPRRASVSAPTSRRAASSRLAPASRDRRRSDRDDRARQARRRSSGRPSRPASAPSRSNRRASCVGWRRSRAAGPARCPILLRAAVAEEARLERVRLVGDDGAGKFGMDARDLRGRRRAGGRSPHLDLLGLHAFGASNVLDAGALVAHVAATVRAARRARAGDRACRSALVDVGGGLGIPYEPHEEFARPRPAGCRARRDRRGVGRRPAARDGARLLLEPGRFLVGPAGAYLSASSTARRSTGATVVILDGGVHHVLRPALVGQEHRVRAARVPAPTASAASRLVPVTVAGPLCSGLDVVRQAAVMVPPRGRRPGRRPGRRRLRLHRVDAAVPVASDPGRGRPPRRPRGRASSASRPRGVAAGPVRSGLVTSRASATIRRCASSIPTAISRPTASTPTSTQVIGAARLAGVERILVPGWDAWSSAARARARRPVPVARRRGRGPSRTTRREVDDDELGGGRRARPPIRGSSRSARRASTTTGVFSPIPAQLANLRRNLRARRRDRQAGDPPLPIARPAERDAQDALLAELRGVRRRRRRRSLIHSFSGPVDYAEAMLELGAAISFSGLSFRRGRGGDRGGRPRSSRPTGSSSRRTRRSSRRRARRAAATSRSGSGSRPPGSPSCAAQDRDAFGDQLVANYDSDLRGARHGRQSRSASRAVDTPNRHGLQLALSH